jgi:predicted transport protein
MPPNSLNKTFATFTKALKKERYFESIMAHLLGLRSYRRFPTDDEFRRDIQTRDLYNFPRRSYWLRRLENHGRKERVAVDEFTIEHILPQNENLPAGWKAALGVDWERVQETWLHTLGNLTLTGYNSEYSDRTFSEKRDMRGGFKESPLKLNQGLGQLDSWNEETIRARAEKLAGMALDVWCSPKLSPQLLAVYKPLTAPGGYSVSDHPRLTSGTLREVFEAFRKEVIALDPCVTEEFLKFTVAYKAETNFVDIEPQARRLLLFFNVTFSDMNDPKGLCRDVTGVGHQGNGDVSIGLASLEELPYVMGLVRQSFEKQMGAGPDV